MNGRKEMKMNNQRSCYSSSALELLYGALKEHGIPSPKCIRNIGFTRWGKNGRYWATAYHDGYCFGDFVNGFSSCVFSKKLESNWKEYRNSINEIAQDQSEEQMKRYEAVACLASQIWERAKPCNSHPYLQKKGIKYHALKTSDAGKLIIPAFSYDNKISTLQYINTDGEKRFLKNGRKQGCFHSIGELKNRILLCEGYATAYSIHEATKELTICCFDAGNLIHVAEKFRNHYLNSEMIICADNDITGIKKAKEAGEAINAVVVFPIFKNRSTNPTDFNDLHQLEGLETVRKQITGAFNYGGCNDE